MIKFSVTYIFIFFSVQIFAQQTISKNLNVGDFLTINACKDNQTEILSMDVYSRLNPYDKTKIDSLTGDGFFKEFFIDESIEAKPLPCIMGGKKYKIAALNEFNVEGGTRRVILCYTSYHLTIIWIDLDKAIANNDISF